MFQPITIKLAGVSFGDCQENIKQWGCRDIGSYAVCRERGNPHDPNAVQVSLFGQYKMGYVPKHIASELAPLIDQGRFFLAEFVSRNEFPEITDTVGLTVRIVETTRR